jgi:hypothetical protein
MRVGRIGGVTFVTALAMVATSGCYTRMLEPDFDAWAGTGVEMMTMFNRPDGFWWQDANVWDSKDDVGVIRIAGNQLTATGGNCGIPGWGDCAATFAAGVAEVSVPDGPDRPSVVYHLERVAGGLEVRDQGDGVLAVLQPRTGGADVSDSEGRLRAVADWDPDDPHRLWVSSPSNALIGWSFGAVPPEIAALAQSVIVNTGSHAPPSHAIVIAAALSWLR